MLDERFRWCKVYDFELAFDCLIACGYSILCKALRTSCIELQGDWLHGLGIQAWRPHPGLRGLLKSKHMGCGRIFG